MPLLAVGIVLFSGLIHASWNLLVRHQRATDMFLQISIVITGIGLAPALLAEFIAPPVLPLVWTNVLLGGTFLGIYYFGLTRGYRAGHFTVVYPLARALPVLLVAFADIARGHAPTPMGWLGIGLVSTGSFLIPLESLREWHITRYWNRTTIWILVAAFSTASYSIVDSSAAQVLPTGLTTALRYNIFESSFALVAYTAILLVLAQPIRQIRGQTNWRLAFVATLFVFGGYTLVLWAFQLSPHASYIIGLRQISIVVGVAAGALFFHEPAARLRIASAAIITTGVLAISLAG